MTTPPEVQPLTSISEPRGATARPVPKHVAIIMDGNGRWAKQRGLPRLEGHRRGREALRRTLKAGQKLGLKYLTIYAFSKDNWQRPKGEIKGLMSLFHHALQAELAELHDNNIRLRFIGERSDFSEKLQNLMAYGEDLTKDNQKFHLNIALGYSSRDAIVNATRRLAGQVKAGELSVNDIDANLFSDSLCTTGIPDPDMLIRTSGEQRISDFLLWELAYTELVFLDVYWPDFDEQHLAHAIEQYQNRDRRFGKLSKTA